MINGNMRLYNYFTLGLEDEYGEAAVSSAPLGNIKMSIEIMTQALSDSILYADATYLGATQAEINDKYIIDYCGKKLKVMYVNPRGRYNIVFLKEYEH